MYPKASKLTPLPWIYSFNIYLLCFIPFHLFNICFISCILFWLDVHLFHYNIWYSFQCPGPGTCLLLLTTLSLFLSLYKSTVCEYILYHVKCLLNFYVCLNVLLSFCPAVFPSMWCSNIHSFLHWFSHSISSIISACFGSTLRKPTNW